MGTGRQYDEEFKKQAIKLEKANRDLEEMNEFLEDAAVFFTASRQKSGKKNG